MKRIGITGLLLAILLSLIGGNAGSASATTTCRKIFYFAWYSRDGRPNEECLELAAVFSWRGWDLVNAAGMREVEPDVVCALVVSGEPSDYDGPNCGSTEEKEGTSEYVKASTETEKENEEAEEKSKC